MAANTTTFSGNLVADPELREVETAKGTRKVVSFRIGVDGAGNGGPDDAGFFNCVAWEPLGVNLHRSLSKGQRVVVSGQMRHRTFKVDGEKRSRIELVVEDAGPSLVWATATVDPKTTRSEAPEPAPEPVAS